MTEEQIKQNAEAYYTKNFTIWQTDAKEDSISTYIAGAHSRDEEVENLQNQIEELSEQLKMTENIQKLRNPWISVEERLPEESEKHKVWLSDTVFVVTNQGDGTSARYDLATKTWCPAKILQGHITHWMPIPSLKGGDK